MCIYIYIHIYIRLGETDAENNQIFVFGRYVSDCTIRPLNNGIHACCVCMFCTGCYLALPSFKSYLHASIADLQSLHNICILFSSVCVFDHDYVSLYGDSMKILLSIQIHIYIYNLVKPMQETTKDLYF